MICRKFLALFFVSFLLFAAGVQNAQAASVALPEVLGSWSLDSSQIAVTPLQTTTGNLGQWTRCVYRSAEPATTLEVILMEGAGPGALHVPEQEQDYRHEPGQGLFDGDSEYKTLTIDGCRAIFERHALLPMVLAVSVSSDLTLTVEGYESQIDEDALVGFAREFLNILRGN